MIKLILVATIAVIAIAIIGFAVMDVLLIVAKGIRRKEMKHDTRRSDRTLGKGD